MGGLMDGWLRVNYSTAYVADVRRRAGWKTDFITRRHAGNLVYFFMLDRCLTRYLIHFDLDIVMYSRAGYSWVAQALAILQAQHTALDVQPPLPKARPEALTSALEWTDRFTCSDSTFITARYYVMDVVRYHRVLRSAAQHTSCQGDVHWEELVSCLTCKRSFKRIDLLDNRSSWVLHFPGPANKRMEYVLTEFVEKGIAVTEQNGFNAARLPFWK